MNAMISGVIPARTLRVLIPIVLAALCAIALPAQVPSRHSPLRVHFVDVGQGDGVLIQTPSGHNVVYDGGENPTRMREYLERLGVRAVGLVIASHNHADHVGGLADVITAFRPPYYMEHGVPAATVAHGRFLAAAKMAGSEFVAPTARRISLGDVGLSVVPPPGIAAWGHDDNSIGLLLEYGTFRLLLAGDAESRQWAWWKTHYPDVLKPVHVHKASRHGSLQGDMADRLARLSPDAIVVSARPDNGRGHPDPTSLRLYAEQGATVYRTDVHGTIVVEADPNGTYEVLVERANRGDAPPAPVVQPGPTPRPSTAAAPARAAQTPAPLLGASMLLRPSSNPRYFENAAGDVVYLVGSHTWNSLVDNGSTGPPSPFDFTAYLDFLEARGHNFIRLWTWDHTHWYFDEGPHGSSYKFVSGPFPWARTGPGLASDGGLKFNLNQFDQAYFDRLRERVQAAQGRGIYVAIMLFEGWTSQFGDIGGHLFKLANNINGINGDVNGDNLTKEPYQLSNPAITAIQEAYVRKVIDTVNDLDNVLYEIANEAGSSSDAWQNHFVDYIKTYEAGKPLKHVVGRTFAQGPPGVDQGTNEQMLASNADWVSIHYTLPDSTPPPAWDLADLNKVSILDTDHIFGIGGDAAWVWKAFLRGHNPIYMDPYQYNVIIRHTVTDEPRLAMGGTRAYAARIDLENSTPSVGIASSGFALVNATARRYLVLATGNSVDVDLSAGAGEWTVEWFDITNRTATVASSVAGGAVRTLMTPGGSANMVAYLLDAGTNGGAAQRSRPPDD
jgi:beta-lactamase superfamily II metal-dependent hydrolase